MKALHTVAALLLIVVVSGQTLVGQAQSSGRHLASSSSSQVSRLLRSTSAQLPNRKTGLHQHPRSTSSAGSPSPAASFLAATRITLSGSAVYPVVRGDFNGDGLPDVVTLYNSIGKSRAATRDGESLPIPLAVLLNTPGQALGAPILTEVSFVPGDLIVVADVNRDGKDDVILVHPNSMDVLISIGNGTFGAPLTLATGVSSPIAARAWDVNHDGLLDIVIVDGASNQAAVLLGNGTGGFAAAQMTSFPGQTSVGVLADVDADGNLDLVTNDTLYPGDGSGGFLVGVPFQSNDGQNAGAGFSDSIAVGDINGDGLLDVITANGFWNTISVFRNQGGRTLIQGGASVWSGNQPVAVALADLNFDGKADLVVVNAAESDLSVFLGRGDGTFLAATTEYAVGGTPSTRPVLADFNGDGDVDVVLSDNQSSVVLALGSGDGTFRAVQDANIVVPPGSNNLGGAISIAAADFNGDGVSDFVVGQSSTSPGLGILVFLTNTGGNLKPGVVYAAGDALSYVATGDLNRDGKGDIVASNWATATVEVLLGNGDGTFGAPTSIALPGIANGLVIADLNGDGWPDVALIGQDASVYILLNDGTGALTLAGTYPISGSGYKLVAADINNDGKIDLGIAMTSTSSIAILLGNGNGTFSSAPDYDTTLPSPYGIGVGDLNKDGFQDLVVTSPATGWIAIALGRGDGSFNAPITYAATSSESQLSPVPGEVVMSDINGDGNLDIVFPNSGYGTIAVLLGDGSGTAFYGPYESAAGGGAFALAVADLNKDGLPDVVTADSFFSGVSVLRNTSGSQPTPDFTLTANPVNLRATPGGTAATSISLSSTNSFIGSIQLTCQNLPQALSCSFAPSAVQLASGQTTTSQLTIAATQSQALASIFGHGFTALAIVPILGGIFLWRVPRRAIGRASALAIFASLMFLSGCGGLAASKGAGQTYSITVKATAWNGTSHSVQMQVTVQ